MKLTDVSSIDLSKARTLRDTGYGTVADLRRATQEDLAEVEEIGPALAALIKAEVGGVSDAAGGGQSDEEGQSAPAEDGSDEPGRETVEPAWRYHHGERSRGALGVDGETLYVGGDDGALHAVDTTSGQRQWQFQGGDVWSAPAIADGTVYLSTGGLCAIDAASGEQLWRFDHCNQRPAVLNGTVYATHSDGTVHAVDAQTGDRRWRQQTGLDQVVAPVVADGTVYVTGDSELAALDAATGEQLWHLEADEQLWRPTVAGGTAYAGSADGHLYAVDVESGRLRWRFETGDEVYSSATVADGAVYVGSDDGNLYALDAATGTERWRFPTGRKVTATPLVIEGTVYVGSDDLYAVDATDGTERWRFELDGAVEETNTPVEADGTIYVAGDTGSSLHAIDAASGTERWRLETEVPVFGSPVVGGGTVCVDTFDGAVCAVPAEHGAAGTETTATTTEHAASDDGSTDDTGSGRDRLRWRFDAREDVANEIEVADADSDPPLMQVASPAVAGGTVYLGTNYGLYAVNSSDGVKRWRFEGTMSGDFVAPPAVVDDSVYAGETKYRLYGLSADSGAEKWCFKIDVFQAGVYASPAVADGVVYVGGGGNVYAVDVDSGEEVWRFETGAEGRVTPVVDAGTVYAGSDDGSLYAVDARSGDERWRFRGDGGPTSTPAVADDTVYVRGENLYAVDATDGTERWNCHLDDEISAPAVADGTVYVGGQRLYAVDATRGTEQWRFQMDGPLSPPAVSAGVVYVGGSDGVYAVDAETGTEQWQFETEQWRYETRTAVETAPTVADGTVYVGGTDGTFCALAAESDTGGAGAAVRVTDIESVDSSVAASLRAAGIESVVDVRDASQEEIARAESVDRVTAGQIQEDVSEGRIDVDHDRVERLLASDDDTTRAKTAVVLGRIASNVPEVARHTDALVGSLRDAPEVVREGAALALGRIAGEAPERVGAHVETVAAGLGDESQFVRTGASLAVQQVAEDSPATVGGQVDALVGALDDPDESVRRRVCSTLRTVAGDDLGRLGAHAGALVARLEDEDEDPETRDAVAETLCAVADGEPEHLVAHAGRVTELLDDDSSDDRVRAAAAFVLATVAAADAERVLSHVEALAARLDDPNPDVRLCVAAALSELAGAEPELVADHADALADLLDEERTEAYAAVALSDIEEVAPGRVPAAASTGPTAGVSRDEAESMVPDLSTVASPPRRDIDRSDLTVGDRLGRGGQAVVRRARLAESPPEYVALKEPLRSETLTTDAVEEFLDEAETWETVDARERTKPRWRDSEYIVGVIDTGDTLPWIAVEYMDGGGLDARLADSPEGLPLQEALWIAESVCRGVELAHNYGIAHLDLKPANVLFRETAGDTWNVPKIADWGLARVLSEQTGTMEGLSVRYATPEQFDPDEFGDPDTLTDVYQIGAMLYAMLTGQPPYTGSQLAVMRDVCGDETPASPSTHRDGLPGAVDQVVLAALEPEKTDRYDSVQAFRRALQALRAGETLPRVVRRRLDDPEATLSPGRTVSGVAGGGERPELPSVDDLVTDIHSLPDDPDARAPEPPD